MNELTAGEFQAVTGLSAKALRLYAERGILVPASVDPDSRYRRYRRSQVRHGVIVDLLRRAQVPLAEMGSAPAFDFDDWREQVQMRRTIEDFHLAVAERVAAFDPGQFRAHSSPAPAQDWVGVIVDDELPADVEAWMEALPGLAVDLPAIDRAFGEALGDLGVRPPDRVWTAVPDTGRAATTQILLARPVAVGVDARSRTLIEQRVRAGSGRAVRAVTGTLPDRVEITFTATAVGGEPTGEPSTVEEAAAGYLHLLAFDEHVARHRLTAIGRTARQVVQGPWLYDLGQAQPVSVFDVHRATG
ncbi:MerR family DNA-binding transcriptional regulator [Pseudonocardia lacus]|uniref:MerR family DNA-binding transcriptional regulator n=1 Tax=Pseudonocardia lacus TaxID=2835865 RepID=UPI0027E2308F|nr:MerR family DNA-binding transcriptional regulator [Pseudonocardia lacus]